MIPIENNSFAVSDSRTEHLQYDNLSRILERDACKDNIY